MVIRGLSSLQLRSTGRRLSSRALFLQAWAILGALLCLFAVGCSTANKHPPAFSGPAAGATTTEQLLGIKVVAIRWSAGGSALDFRFRVIDPAKALPLMDRSIDPYLIDEVSGAKFGIPRSPKIGPMRQTTRHPEVDRVYWMLFANPARYVKKGNRVTVVFGDIRLEHLIVQ